MLKEHGIPQSEGWARYIQPVADPDRAEACLTMPALLFQGDRDRAFDLADTIALADRLKQGRMEVVVGADHSLNRQPERVLPLITPFLLEHAAG